LGSVPLPTAVQWATLPHLAEPVTDEASTERNGRLPLQASVVVHLLKEIFTPLIKEKILLRLRAGPRFCRWARLVLWV
jgi:hypothetical protein